MKVGFSALALFNLSFDKIVQRASIDGFDAVEVLCEGPYLPRFALKVSPSLRFCPNMTLS